MHGIYSDEYSLLTTQYPGRTGGWVLYVTEYYTQTASEEELSSVQQEQGEEPPATFWDSSTFFVGVFDTLMNDELRTR